LFRDKDTALTVREHMANVIWILTSSATISPVAESSTEEQITYNKAISKICDVIFEAVLDPICEKHPMEIEREEMYYKKYFPRDKS